MFTAKEQQYFNILNVVMFASLILFTIPNFSFFPALISLLALVLLNVRRSALPVQVSGINLTIILYLIVMGVNIVFINPVFHVEGLYFISFIGLAFFFGNSLRPKEIIIFRNIGCIFLLGILLIGCTQYIFHFPTFHPAANRVNGVFTTSNSYAAFINLFLIPLLVLKLSRSKVVVPEWLIFILFFSLLFTQSRGGWLAALVGTSFGVFFLLIIKQINTLRHTAIVLFKLLLIFLAFLIIEESGIRGTQLRDDMFMLSTQAPLSVEGAETKSMTKGDSIKQRMFFYDVAIKHFKEKPILGHGYYNFQYFMLRNSDVNMRNFGNTRYTHNDYLQHLMETGVIGLTSLLLIILAIYRQLFRSLTYKEHLLIIVALASGFSSYMAHAMIDFLFYMPGLTVIFFLLLGIFDRMTSKQESAAKIEYHPQPLLTQNLKNTFAFLAIMLFCTPFIAQACYQRAESLVEANQFIEAQKMYGYAQTVAPYNPTYYRAEAELWRKALNVTPDIETFGKIDSLLEQGSLANPYEPESLMARAKLHRDIGMQLGVNTSWDEIISWQQKVTEWRPNLNIAKKELVTTLQKAGRTQEARELYAELQQEILGKREVQSFLKRILK